MTELSTVSHIIPPAVKNSKAGSCGALLPGIKSKVLDPETGEVVVGRNIRGEFCLKGPNVCIALLALH
jgi:long-subunit acyl-CoA synthetase (AMP-forming)